MGIVYTGAAIAGRQLGFRSHARLCGRSCRIAVCIWPSRRDVIQVCTTIVSFWHRFVGWEGMMTTGRIMRPRRGTGRARLGLLGRITAGRSLVFRSMGVLATLTLVLVAACSAGSGQSTSTQPGSGSTETHVPNSHQVWIDPASNPFNETTPAYKPVKVDLAGDGTYELRNMTWQVWNSSEAIGTGTAYIDDCNPYCANGGWHEVPVRAVFSQPVDECTAKNGQGATVSGSPRYWWSQVDLTYPAGLPAALSGPNKPYGLWKFGDITAWAQQSCAGLSALARRIHIMRNEE